MYILRNELKCLLKDLAVPITKEKELDKLFEELDPDGEGAVGFDNFFGCTTIYVRVRFCC